jgi:predicted CoA-binding protein
MHEATRDFLAQKCIAVIGVSRTQNKTANFIYRKLRSEGYKIVAVNPNATTVEGDISYPDLKTIPEKPGVVIIVTKPEVAGRVVRECAELGIDKVWMHQGMDSKGTSVSEEAVAYCRKNGITVIPGGCPMMYCRHADIGHRVMRWLLALKGSLPKEV